jgi:hypothetical protein
MQDVASTSVVPQQKSELAQRVLKGAWVGVLLGLLLEALLLVVALWQDRLPDRVHIVAETVQKLSWSALVCAALVAGQAAVRAGTSIAGLIVPDRARLAQGDSRSARRKHSDGNAVVRR